MLDSIQFNKLHSKPVGDHVYKTTSLIPSDEKSFKAKQTEDEEFYRIMELIKTEKNDQNEYLISQAEPEEKPIEAEDIENFMLFMVVITLLTSRVIRGFQNIITRVKDIFDQCFPYIWSWMKSITRGTYAVAEGKVGLFLLCVPLLTLVLFLYCSLLTFNAVTELLLSNAPAYVTQIIVNEKINKLFIRQKIH